MNVETPEFAHIAAILYEWAAIEPRIRVSLIAERAKVSEPTVRKWLSGHSCPNLVEIQALEELRPGLLDKIFPRIFRDYAPGFGR